MFSNTTNMKRTFKEEMKHQRRQIEKIGLEKAKKVFNNTKNLEEVRKVDYFTDKSFIKRKSRKQSNADYIDQRCSGSRIIIGYYS